MNDPVVLPAATRHPAPWKNGGGTTYEIYAYPPGSDLESFAWRISMANVIGESPFSRFEDIDRTLMLLDGELDLACANPGIVTLRAYDEPHRFKGDQAVVGRAGSKGARDLNVMTRAGLAHGTIQAMPPQQSAYAHEGEGTSILLVTQPALVSFEQSRYQLSTWDALKIECAGRLTVETEGHWLIVRVERSGPGRA